LLKHSYPEERAITATNNMKKPAPQVLKPKRLLFGFYLKIILFLIFIGMCVLIGFLINYWLERNTVKFQSPIVLQTPVWIEQIESAEAKEIRVMQEKIQLMEASEEAKPKDAPVVNKLWQKQSDISILKKKTIPSFYI